MLEKNLKKLISFPTITGNHAEVTKSYVWVRQQLKNLPIYFREFKFREFTSLLITTRKTKRPVLWLVAHIDVVPGSEQVFKPKTENGNLYGRGSFDMKFAIAVYLELFKSLGKDLNKYNIGIMITPDEEIGGENGVGKLLNSGFVSRYAFLPDGGRDFMLERSAKGTVNYEIICVGKSTHASRVWEGESATEKLIDFLQELKKEFPQEPCQTIHHQHNTFNVGKISGGLASNSVADLASASVNIRFTSGYTLKLIEKIIKAKLKRYKNISIIESATGESAKYDYKNPFNRLFVKILKKRIKKIKFIDSHGTSDGRYFIAKKIPVILTRPKGGGHHSEKEWVNIQSLQKFYQILKEFVLNLPDIQ